MNLPGPVRALGRAGLWSLVLPAAALPPLLTTVAIAHADQWPVGPMGGAADPWQGFVVPFTFRAFGLLMALLLAGHACGLAPADPRPLRRLPGALLRAALIWGVVLVAALPGTLWIVRLGAVPATFALGRAAVALGTAGLGALLGATAGALLPPWAAGPLSLGTVGGMFWFWALR